MERIRIGGGEIPATLLKLPLSDFLAWLPMDFKRVMLIGNTDEKIDAILTELWNGANPQPKKKKNGSDTVTQEDASIGEPTNDVDNGIVGGDGTVLNPTE